VNLHDELVVAQRAADLADAITLPAFRDANFAVELKYDRTEVTAIDRAAEQGVRSLIAEARPTHAITGEEFGLTGDDSSPWRWVIDPIDGTSNFVRGVPVWATLIALVFDNTPVLGFVSAPALATRWWATRGNGAWCNGAMIRVSEVRSLDEAHVSITPNDAWAETGRLEALLQLQREAARARGFGDFWQHMLVAQGALDVAIDAIGLGSYDTAALYPIVTEAGGRATDRFGAVNWQSNSLITTNGLLHDTVVASVA
jgi:histidinol-phosphatase